jgi:hypothetical protein
MVDRTVNLPAVRAVRVEAGHGARAAGGAAVDEAHPAPVQGACMSKARLRSLKPVLQEQPVTPVCRPRHNLGPVLVVSSICESHENPAQALPGRVARLREGGLAALRELRDADNEESRAQANAEESLKVLSTLRMQGWCACRRSSQYQRAHGGGQTGVMPFLGNTSSSYRIAVARVVRRHNSVANLL